MIEEKQEYASAEQLSKTAPGRFVSGIFLISTLRTKTTKSGSEYRDVRISDSTGEISCPVWEDFAEIDQFSEGDIAEVSGLLSFYDQKPQIKKPSFEKPEEVPEEIMNRLIAAYNVPKEILEYFENTVQTLHYPYNLFAMKSTGCGGTDVKLFNQFCRCPSALRHHGNKIGGLLLHTVGVMKGIDFMLKNYFETPFFPYGKIEEVNPSRLRLKAILHDVAKMEDYKFDGCFGWNGTTKLDHRGKGLMYIAKINAEMNEPLSDDDIESIAYSILSHHGSYGNGQYTFDNIEDFMLHMADMMDSNLVGALESGSFKFS